MHSAIKLPSFKKNRPEGGDWFKGTTGDKSSPPFGAEAEITFQYLAP